MFASKAADVLESLQVRDPLRETGVIDRKKAYKPLSRGAGEGG